jgi:hypothetical protein
MIFAVADLAGPREPPEGRFMIRIALAAIAATTMLFASAAYAQQQFEWDKAAD